MEQLSFKFPDEPDQTKAGSIEPATPDLEIEIVDDTPPQDRGREPMPKEIVKELEEDDLEEYSDKVKKLLSQMKKVWHDERREKERAQREHAEAIALAKKVMEENKRLKSTLSEGEKQYASTIQSAAELELEMAKRAYRDAYDSGEADRIVEAQQKLTEASLKQRSEEHTSELQSH